MRLDMSAERNQHGRRQHCRRQPYRHSSGSDRRRAAGLSIVELIVTLVVLSIMAAVSIPLITSVVNSSRVTGSANEVLGAVQTARMEAIRRNSRVAICGSLDANPTNCAGGGNWESWAVIADSDGNGLFNAADEVVTTGSVEAPLSLTASSNIGNQIVFRADGMAYDGNLLLAGNLRVCSPSDEPPTNARNISVMSGSRFVVGAAVVVPINCPQPPN
jgi:type IV fimbrial biogenesis protein FimT